MKVAMEHLSSILRIWDDDQRKYHSPFKFVCTVRWLSRHRIELAGLRSQTSSNAEQTDDDPAITIEQCRAIAQYCRKLGIRKVKIVRRKNGRRRVHWVNIRKVTGPQ